MESAWVFNVGLLFLMISISKINHWSFPRHFLRTLKFVLRFIRFKLCFSKKCLPIPECLCFLYTLMEVTAHITDIICIAQITFEFINNILLVHYLKLLFTIFCYSLFNTFSLLKIFYMLLRQFGSRHWMGLDSDRLGWGSGVLRQLCISLCFSCKP